MAWFDYGIEIIKSGTVEEFKSMMDYGEETGLFGYSPRSFMVLCYQLAIHCKNKNIIVHLSGPEYRFSKSDALEYGLPMMILYNYPKDAVAGLLSRTTPIIYKWSISRSKAMRDSLNMALMLHRAEQFKIIVASLHQREHDMILRRAPQSLLTWISHLSFYERHMPVRFDAQYPTLCGVSGYRRINGEEELIQGLSYAISVYASLNVLDPYSDLAKIFITAVAYLYDEVALWMITRAAFSKLLLMGISKLNLYPLIMNLIELQHNNGIGLDSLIFYSTKMQNVTNGFVPNYVENRKEGPPTEIINILSRACSSGKENQTTDDNIRCTMYVRELGSLYLIPHPLDTRLKHKEILARRLKETIPGMAQKEHRMVLDLACMCVENPDNVHAIDLELTLFLICGFALGAVTAAEASAAIAKDPTLWDNAPSWSLFFKRLFVVSVLLRRIRATGSYRSPPPSRPEQVRQIRSMLLARV